MPLRFSGGFGRPGQKPRENCGSRLARVAEAATMPNPFEYRQFRPATRENCNGIAPDPFSSLQGKKRGRESLLLRTITVVFVV